MPVELSNTFLLERVFAPVPIPKIGADKLAALYNEAPDYAAEIKRGTLEEKEDLTPEEQKGLEKFHQQFNTVIIKLKSACRELKIDTKLLPNLDVFAERFLSRKYYVKQSSLFYTQIKEALESCLINLSGNTLQRSENKKRIMEDLLLNIIYCGPGVFNHIQTARQELESHNTIEAWNAKFRKTIIKQLAHAHLIRKGISQNNITHVENVFLRHALNKEWYPYGYETLDAINEIHIELAQVNDEDIVIFEKEFLKRFNPTTIMTELAQTLNSCLADKINITRGTQDFIEIKTNGELAVLFSGIPILNEENTLLIVFSNSEATEEKTVKSPVLIRFGDDLKVKPLTDLMLSMTRYFVESKEDRLFQALAHEAKDINLILIPESPQLSYSSTPEGELLPYNKNTAVEIDLETFKKLKFPVYEAQLKYFYEQGARDFTDCIFENIDFTQPLYEDLGKLILKNVQFGNSKINRAQFINLWKREWKNSGEDKQEHEVLRLAKQWKYHGILFYAVLHNLPSVIRELMLAGAVDILVLPNEPRTTPIEFAITLGHWDCVKELANQKSADKIPHTYEVVLLKAAINGQCNVVRLLASLGVNVNRIHESGKTALYSAAEYGNSNMVHQLLNVGANQKISPSNQHHPIVIAAINRHWDCVKALSTKKEVSNEYQYHFALLFAATYNQTEIVTRLLDQGTNPYAMHTVSKNTALHYAAQHGNIAMAKALLAKGHAIGATNANNQQHLGTAAIAGHWEYIKELAKLDNRDKICEFGSDPTSVATHRLYKEILFKAANNHRWDVVIALDKDGHFIYSRDNAGNLLLHLAAKNGNVEMAERILTYAWPKDDLYASTNNAGLFPIEIAAGENQWTCVEALASIAIDDLKKIPNATLLKSAYSKILSKAAHLHQLPTVFLLSTILYPHHKNTNVIATFNSLPGVRGKIAIAILDYYHSGGSWTSLPNSKRRKKDIVNLLRIVSNEKEDKSAVEKVFNYCQNEIKTGFFDNSALRSKVFTAIQPYATHFLSGRRHQILEAILSYQEQGGSWTSKPHSKRREADVYHLMKLVSEDKETEGKKATTVEQRIRSYCENNIKTGFWGRSALRDKVLEAMDAPPKRRWLRG